MTDPSASPLCSERLVYRPILDEERIDDFHALCIDPHVRHYLLDGEIVERPWTQQAVTASAALMAEMGAGLWLVEHEGAPIGFCGFRRFDDLTPEPQLLYALTEAQSRRGFATEMVDALLRYVGERGWRRVVTAVDAPNEASLRVLDKHGFRRCGYLPGAFGDIVILDRWAQGREPPALLPRSRHRLTIASTWDGHPCDDGERVEIVIEAEVDEIRLAIDAPFHGDPAPESEVGSTPRLWEREVVEVMFLGEHDRYLEIELSPHGHHLALILEGRRNVVHQGMVMYHQATIEGARWRGRARVPLGWLPRRFDRLNAYAIHGAPQSGRRHLAWRAPGGDRPDFHRLEHFGRLDALTALPR